MRDYNLEVDKTLRVSLLVSTVLVLAAFFVFTSVIKVHSQSDVSYRQESIFLGAGLAASKEKILEPEGVDELKAISMSYEIDKVTPTPIPKIDPVTDDVWIKLAQCESKQNWKADTGNGYFGGLQFSQGAWNSVGGSGKPSDASAEEQISKGKLLQSKRGWGPWGGCSKKLGLL